MDEIIRPTEAARRLGIARTTLYGLISAGLLPKPIPVSIRAVGWRESTLIAYLNRREAAGVARAAPDEQMLALREQVERREASS